mmetsp:Transcript_14371/g.45309  ORF Transcript_14371/g.45309 Transcript_14371/m.45309 type:complete len:221 (-) Transcript_14371:130-792(-)
MAELNEESAVVSAGKAYATFAEVETESESSQRWRRRLNRLKYGAVVLLFVNVAANVVAPTAEEVRSHLPSLGAMPCRADCAGASLNATCRADARLGERVCASGSCSEYCGEWAARGDGTLCGLALLSHLEPVCRLGACTPHAKEYFHRQLDLLDRESRPTGPDDCDAFYSGAFCAVCAPSRTCLDHACAPVGGGAMETAQRLADICAAAFPEAHRDAGCA